MQNVNIEFIIKLNKNIYENISCKSESDFFNKFVLNYIADDYTFINRMLSKKSLAEQKMYHPYLETIKTIKDSILNSVKYEVLSVEISYL